MLAVVLSMGIYLFRTQVQVVLVVGPYQFTAEFRSQIPKDHDIQTVVAAEFYKDS